MGHIASKWNPATPNTAFQTYLYNAVGAQNAPLYRPSNADNLPEWDEAFAARPGPEYVPVKLQGPWMLGQRIIKQKIILNEMQIRLHEINASLSAMMTHHDMVVQVRLPESRRKHRETAQRCLRLAVKVQILQNRGYSLDGAEEELRQQILKLERGVFDPALVGRSEEIWARMMAIRERSKRLQAEIDRTGKAAVDEDAELDEETVKAARKVRSIRIVTEDQICKMYMNFRRSAS